MKRIFFGIISFLFIPTIVVSVLSVVGINSGISSMIGIGAWVYLFFFYNRNGRGNPIKKDNPNATPCFMVVDVETTGLIKYDETPTKKNLEEDADNFLKIVQFAWTSLSRNYEIVSKKNFYIKQSKPIPVSAIEIHNITDEICEKKGKILFDVLKEFSKDIEACDYYVGHNVMFDKRVIEAECIRSRVPKPFKYMKKYDTMQMGRKIMDRRWFKLEELGMKMFGKKQMKQFNLHSAEDDVEITSVCFAWLHKKGYKY